MSCLPTQAASTLGLSEFLLFTAASQPLTHFHEVAQRTHLPGHERSPSVATMIEPGPPWRSKIDLLLRTQDTATNVTIVAILGDLRVSSAERSPLRIQRAVGHSAVHRVRAVNTCYPDRRKTTLRFH